MEHWPCGLKKVKKSIISPRLYKNVDFGRKYDKEEDKCHGKFARVSFDSVELANEAGYKIRGPPAKEEFIEADKSLIYFSEGVPLTGGYSVNNTRNGRKSQQLVGRAGQYQRRDTRQQKEEE